MRFVFDNVEVWHFDEVSRRERCGWQNGFPRKKKPFWFWMFYFHFSQDGGGLVMESSFKSRIRNPGI